MTTWNEFKVYAASAIEDPLTDYLMEIGSAGVSIQKNEEDQEVPHIDGDTLSGLEPSLFPETGMVVTAYFPEDEDVDALEANVREKITELEALGFIVGPVSFASSAIKEEDWENAWKQHYHTQRISRFLTIVPEWEDYVPAQKEEKCIRLDPGLAFGTGTHPTTLLSLHALEAILRGGETVLDVGTGSGVLTIASAHLGAKKVYAYDLDENATSATRGNVLLNELDAEITVDQNDLLKGLSHQADVIVANILAEIILKLIDDAWTNLKEDGYFITSGVIQTKRVEIEEALQDKGFSIYMTFQMGDWVTIVSQKITE